MTYFSLVLFAALATVAYTERCYIGVSSPDEINGIYAPYHADAWRILTAYGLWGKFELKKDTDGKYFFFKDGTKILTEARVDFTTDKKCITHKTDFLSAWPKTYVYSMPYAMGPPFLGEIEAYKHVKEATQMNTYWGCFNWVMKQKSAEFGLPDGLFWTYDDVCRATWGGNPTKKKVSLPNDSASRTHASAPAWMHKHPRSQDLSAQAAPGSTMERIYIGRASNIYACLDIAKDKGEPVSFLSYKSGLCYRSTDRAIEQVTDSHSGWTYLAMHYSGSPLDFTKTFHCTAKDTTA